MQKKADEAKSCAYNSGTQFLLSGRRFGCDALLSAHTPTAALTAVARYECSDVTTVDENSMKVTFTHAKFKPIVIIFDKTVSGGSTRLLPRAFRCPVEPET